MSLRGQCADPIGTAKHAGSVTLADGTTGVRQRRSILSVSRDPQIELREERGLAQLHVQTAVKDGGHITLGVNNCRVLLEVSWSTGISGGQMTVDVTKGAKISLGAADHVSASAYLDYAKTDETFRNTHTWLVTGNVFWDGTHNPEPPYMSSYLYSLAGAGGTSPVGGSNDDGVIPPMARTMVLLGDNPATFTTARLEVYSPGVVGSTARLLCAQVGASLFTTPIPVANGAHYFRVVNNDPDAGDVLVAQAVFTLAA